MDFISEIPYYIGQIFAKMNLRQDFDTKVKNEPVEKNSSQKIGQKGQHPTRAYNIDHFFANFLFKIPTMISTTKKTKNYASIETKFVTKKLKKTTKRFY